MHATALGPVGRGLGSWRRRPGWLVALVVAATVAAGCSDNNGRMTPTSASTTGFADSAADIRVQLGVNPNSITPGRRAGVTAFVTNTRGLPLAGKTVQFSTDVGSLDRTVVTTNASGQASTTLSITPTDAINAQGQTSATVTAFVDGAVGTGTVNFGAPSTLVIIPGTVSQTNTTGGASCAFTVNFSASGGTPPFTFSAGIAANLVGTTYSTPVNVGGTVTDTVTVTDSVGATASAPVSLTCNAI
jgi:hypothetical protein